jgi:CRISPR/Cas system CSM-associated protein Csm2 small subunit
MPSLPQQRNRRLALSTVSTLLEILRTVLRLVEDGYVSYEFQPFLRFNAGADDEFRRRYIEQFQPFLRF